MFVEKPLPSGQPHQELIGGAQKIADGSRQRRLGQVHAAVSRVRQYMKKILNDNNLNIMASVPSPSQSYALHFKRWPNWQDGCCHAHYTSRAVLLGLAQGSKAGEAG